MATYMFYNRSTHPKPLSRSSVFTIHADGRSPEYDQDDRVIRAGYQKYQQELEYAWRTYLAFIHTHPHADGRVEQWINEYRAALEPVLHGLQYLEWSYGIDAVLHVHYSGVVEARKHLLPANVLASTIARYESTRDEWEIGHSDRLRCENALIYPFERLGLARLYHSCRYGPIPVCLPRSWIKGIIDDLFSFPILDDEFGTVQDWFLRHTRLRSRWRALWDIPWYLDERSAELYLPPPPSPPPLPREPAPPHDASLLYSPDADESDEGGETLSEE